MVAGAPPQVTLREILESVAHAYGFSIKEIVGPGRTRPLVAARHVAMYLVREMTDLSFSAIAWELGNRDYTTVVHG
jgi:chromosomal replication initiator protein